MRSLALALVALLALVAIAFTFLWGAAEDEPAPEQAAGPAAAERATEPASHPSASASAEAPAKAPDLAAGVERESVPARPAAPYVFHVRVVRAPSLAPFPGARVWSSAESADPQGWTSGHSAPWSADPEAFLAEAGRAWLCDGEGRVSIGNACPRIALAGRDGEWFGANTFELESGAPEGEIRLFLAKDETLVFRAVDGDGAPLAGIWAQCEFLAPDSRGIPNTVKVGPSDQDGLMRIRHIQVNRHVAGGSVGAAVRVVLLGGTLPAEHVALQPLPDTPLLLRVPDHAMLDIVCLGHDGRPWTLREGESDLITLWSHGGGGGSQHRLAPDGTVRIGPVLCGAKFTLTWPSTKATASATAPARRGETLRVELVAREHRTSLSARLLDNAGRPLQGTYLLTIGPPSRRTVAEIRTGEDGRFHQPLLDSPPSPPLVIDVGTTRVTPLPDSLCARIEWTRPLLAGPNELGDIVLAAPLELLTLRVEWQDGGPVREPLLRLRGPGARDVFDDPILRSDPAGEGQYSVRGPSGFGPITVRATHREAVTHTEASFAEGVAHGVIPMTRGGSLATRCLVDPELPWEEFEFSLRREAPTGAPHDRLVMAPAPASRNGPAVLRWSGVREGRYTLAIAAVPGERPFRELAGLEIRAGEATTDERLREIDLRGALSRVELRIRDELGEAVGASKLLVLRRVPESEHGWYGHLARDGVAVLAVARPVDLRIAALGYRLQDLPGVARDLHVSLSRVPRLRVRLAAEIPSGMAIWVNFVPPDGALEGGARYRSRNGDGNGTFEFGWGGAGVAFREGGAAQGWQPGLEGTYGVILRVARETKMVPVENPTPLVVDTKGLATDSVVTISPDPEALARAFEQLSR